MKAEVRIRNKNVLVDLSNGIDISLPMGKAGSKAWHVEDVTIEPVRSGSFVGSIEAGSPVNFMNVSFNPHGNGTHTECISHISRNSLTVNDLLKDAFLLCSVISIDPVTATEDDGVVKSGDRVIMPGQIEAHIDALQGSDAVAIRTLPNSDSKIDRVYSGTNPDYFHSDSIRLLVDHGIDHILTDLPSLDREEDGGLVSSHHAFWGLPDKPHIHRTITELIYIQDQIRDGLYLLNLQVAPFAMDASPSRPLLFPIK